MIATEEPQARASSGGHDRSFRRKSTRRGRQKGANVYIPAADLMRAGYDPEAPPPYYRTWGAPRGRIVIQLYKGD